MTWHPVSLSRDIEPGTSAGTVLMGKEIALWRDTKGAIHAWEDRCPHRGMKLSFGFVRGDHIACLYHGWEYGSDGRCRKIPAHPALEVPASICVKTYVVAEVGGMVLVSLDGDEAERELADITPVRSVFLDCALEDAIALLQSGNPLGVPARIAGKFAYVGDLVIGLQSCTPTACALHIAVLGRPSQAQLVALYQQATAFRRFAERQPA